MNAHLRTASNLAKVIVAPNGVAAHGLGADVDVSGGLAAGVVAVVTRGMITHADIGDVTAGEDFHVVQGMGVGQGLLVSPPLNDSTYAAIESIKTYLAPSYQTTYVGYDGSTGVGAIDAADASETYVITVINENPNASDRSQPTRVTGNYTSPATGASDEDTATEIVGNLAKNLNKRLGDSLRAEMVNSGAHVALGTSVDTVTFTNGSRTVSATDIDDATGGGTALAAGNLLVVPGGDVREVTITGTSGTANISINGTTYLATFDTNVTTTAANWVAAHDTALFALGIDVAAATGVITVTNRNPHVAITPFSIANASGDLAGTLGEVAGTATPCYYIDSIDATANTVTLNYPYQGPNVVFDDLELQQIDTTANYGIKITSKARAFDVARRRNHYVPRFTCKIGGNAGTNWGTTTVTTPTKSRNGHGTAPQAMMDFYESLGFYGEGPILGTPPQARSAFPGTDFDQYTVVNYAISNSVGSLVSGNTLKSNFILYLGLDENAEVGANGSSFEGDGTYE